MPLTPISVLQATDSVAVENILQCYFDEPGIEMDEMPTFFLRVPNVSGVDAHKLAAGKDVIVPRSAAPAFYGIVESCKPSGGPNGRFLDIRGVHKGYKLLQARVCDDYDFDEDGKAITTRDAVTINPWRYFTFRKAGSALDVFGQETAYDGVRPDQIAKCLIGSEFTHQIDFRDNTYLKPSQAFKPLTSSYSESSLTPNDASGNGLNLTAIGSPTSRTSPQSKYGIGYDFNGTSQRLESTAAGFDLTGDFAATFAFEMDGTNVVPFSKSAVTLDGTSATNTNYHINVTTTQVQYFHHNGNNINTGNVLNSAALSLATGFHTGTIRRTTSDKRVVVKIDGVEVINATYSNDTTGGSSSDFTVGAVGTGSGGYTYSDVAVYEIRLWGGTIPTQAVLDAISNTADTTHRGVAEGTEDALFFFGTPSTTAGTPQYLQVYRDGPTGDIRPALQRPRTGDTFAAGLDVETIPLENGDQNIDPMGDISACSVLLIGQLNGTQDPTLEVSKNARNTPNRTYTSITLTRLSNYLGSGLTAWSGSASIPDNPNTNNSLAFRITIPGSSSDTATTKVQYMRFTATTRPDTGLSEGTIAQYSNPVAFPSGDQDWLETDLSALPNRLDAMERVRTLTESAGGNNTSPHWDMMIDDQLRFHFVERRGQDVLNHDYSFANANLEVVEHEYYGKEVAFQTIAYGAGSGSATVRIVSKADYDTDYGLYDADRDPGGLTRLHGDLPRVLPFVDSNETGYSSLLRKARAFHKLHRDPIENFSVKVDSEHLRYFTVGDRIRVIDLPSRVDGFLRVVGLRRNFSGSGKERLDVRLGEPVDDFASHLASTATETEINSVRAAPSPIDAGVAGNGYKFDKDHYAICRFGIPDGKRLKGLWVKFTTVPWTGSVKSVSPFTQGIFTFVSDADTTGVGTPKYAAGVKWAVDPTLGSDGLPSNFLDEMHPVTFGSTGGPVSHDFPVIGYLDTEANDIVKDGEHIIALLGTAQTNNTNGLSEVSITLIPVYETPAGGA